MTGHGRKDRGRGLGFAASLLAIALLAPPFGSAYAAAPAGKPAEKSGPAFGPALFDKTKPIEITSDRLDVDQEAKVAIFEGKVDAIQGAVHLRADRLKVYYDAVTEETASAAPPATPPSTGETASGDPMEGGGRIRRMDVDGNVFVSSPTETASGERGVYNADTGKVTLLGNVVLTRGGNVIRGTKLSIDVDTGRSVIDADSSVGGGRVKGLFVPKKDQSQNGQAAKDGAPEQ